MDPALAALLGALVGGGFAFLGTWYHLKKQREKDIWIKNISRFEEADAKLFTPFLKHAYRLDVKHDVDDIDRILEALRDGRSYFNRCPKDLRQKLFELYSTLERRVVEKEGKWKTEDIDNIAPNIKQIETLIYDAFSSMEL